MSLVAIALARSVGLGPALAVLAGILVLGLMLLGARAAARPRSPIASHDAAVPVPSRRTMLKGGLLAVAGAAGWGAGGLTSGGSSAPAASATASSLRLHGARLKQATTGEPEPGRLSAHGELVDPSGGRLGSFSSTRLAVPASPGSEIPGAEFQIFELHDGAIFGLGTPRADGTKATYAIVGGTGRYSGAAGSYVADQRLLGAGGNGTADFKFTLAN